MQTIRNQLNTIETLLKHILSFDISNALLIHKLDTMLFIYLKRKKKEEKRGSILLSINQLAITTRRIAGENDCKHSSLFFFLSLSLSLSLSIFPFHRTPSTLNTSAYVHAHAHRYAYTYYYVINFYQ